MNGLISDIKFTSGSLKDFQMFQFISPAATGGRQHSNLPFKYSPSPEDHWALTADEATEGIVFTALNIAMSKPHDGFNFWEISEMKEAMNNIQCDFKKKKKSHFFVYCEMISLLRIYLKEIS